MKAKRMLGVLALAFAALTMATGPALAAPPPPSGKPLPAVTFRIQDNSLNCVDAVQDASDDHLVFIDPCDVLNLNEQFTYNALTKQIVSVTKLQCLDAPGGDVRYVPCDATRNSQKFVRTGPDSEGRYRIVTYTNNKQRTPIYLVGDSGILRSTTNLAGQPAVDLLFRFPLV